ncbi:hypothetical protein CLV81_3665 [Flagellimonas meridianipacifica]|uniref:Uncharacterized protein n=1 Tax=Flagellimonas meridianipacifica TaxID=1080225 RepID=A0A2T0MCP7_9FLAO|nr:hypothetical protein CLV81_3665 [Allomuricauda pacifica]
MNYFSRISFSMKCFNKIDWNTINKILGGINLVIGILLLIKTYYLTDRRIYYLSTLPKKGFIPNTTPSFAELLLKDSIQLTIGILLVSSGLLIFLKRKLGWILGYCGWLISIVSLITFVLFRLKNDSIVKLEFNSWIQIMNTLIPFLSLISILLLSLKPVREVNRISFKSWFLSLIFFSILMLVLSVS